MIISSYNSGIYLVCSGLLFSSKPCSQVNGIQTQGLGLFTARLEQISIVVMWYFSLYLSVDKINFQLTGWDIGNI